MKDYDYHLVPNGLSNGDIGAQSNGSIGNRQQSSASDPASYPGQPPGRRKYCCYCLCVFVVGVWITYIYFQSGSSVRAADYAFYYSLLESVNGGDPTCHIPHPDPWDKTILQYIEKVVPLNCKAFQPELTYLDAQGLLHFNASAMKAWGYSSLRCTYRCFRRREGVDDKQIDYDALVPLAQDKPQRVNCSEFMEVSCSKSFPAVTVYTNLHSHVLVNRTRLDIIARDQRARQRIPARKGVSRDKRAPPSVLLFVIDSVSRSNFLRALPKTYKVLTDQYGAVDFKGYSKVGDNSFPNAAAFLFGKRVQVMGYKADIPQDMSNEFYDGWPFVWKNFSRRGYVTYYAEDYPNFNLFYYLSKGFRSQPTDHYFRPYWVVLWNSFVHLRSSPLCYGNRHKHKLQLNYLRSFWTKYNRAAQRVPKFGLNWLTELSHDYLNAVKVGDDDLAAFFTDMKSEFANTILAVMADHGHRFAKIRESVIGRIEERMPFFALSLPRWMRDDYPTLVSNLRNNSQMLTSPYDLYATLMDVLHADDWSPDAASRLDATFAADPLVNLSSRGSSLFRPLPLDRTCDDASIPEEFCICQREVTANVSDPKVVRAADELVRFINDQILRKSSKICAHLDLTEIRNAQTFVPNTKLIMDPRASIFLGGKHPSGFYVNYRVAIETSPSGALFEGTLRHTLADSRFVVTGDINRINRYGNQSVCVDSPILRKFCYCKE